MSDDLPRSAHRLVVLVVAKIEAARELVPPAARDECGRKLQVAILAGESCELDERRLDLRVAVGPGLLASAEVLVDQVGETAGDVEQPRLAPRPRKSDRRLN